MRPLRPGAAEGRDLLAVGSGCPGLAPYASGDGGRTWTRLAAWLPPSGGAASLVQVRAWASEGGLASFHATWRAPATQVGIVQAQESTIFHGHWLADVPSASLASVASIPACADEDPLRRAGAAATDVVDGEAWLAWGCEDLRVASATLVPA